MRFALEENEPFSIAIKRIAVEQIDLALDHLKAASENLNEAIHATRQSLKRLRALAALARFELGEDLFKREWNCYRSAGRLLAGGRDAAAVVETFDALIGRFSFDLPAEAFASEHRFLAERRDARLKIMVEEEGALLKASEVLAAARARVATWPLKDAGFKAYQEGVRCSYRAGREGLLRVSRHPSPTNFHEWRRPVKLLWHQLQILTPLWPAVLNAHADELRNLSDRLNENHDLDALRHAAFWAQFETQAHDRQALISLVGHRCRVLEAEALPVGERLYSERSRYFSNRIKHYWRAREHAYADGAILSSATGKIAITAGV